VNLRKFSSSSTEMGCHDGPKNKEAPARDIAYLKLFLYSRIVCGNGSRHTHCGLDFALAIVYIFAFLARISTIPTTHLWVVGVFTILEENAKCEGLVLHLS